MVIDTSAVVAILLGEPEAESFALAIARRSQKTHQCIYSPGGRGCHGGEEGRVRWT